MINERRFAISFLKADQLKAFVSLPNELSSKVIRAYVSSDLLLDDADALRICNDVAGKMPWMEWILSLPEILRSKEESYFKEVDSLIAKNAMFAGVLTGSMEGLGYYAEKKVKVYGDHNLYLWNSHAVKAVNGVLAGGCLPLELKGAEQKDLLELPITWDKIVYGRIPMMVTANCVAKTTDRCRRGNQREQQVVLLDRMDKSFPVRLVCRHCYNVIYNCLPLSLHKELDRYQEKACFRLQFTVEDRAQTERVLAFFLKADPRDLEPPYAEYTTGHEKRGVQ